MLGLPGIVASAALTGFLATIIFDASMALTITLTAGSIIILLRVVTWARFVARRAVVASDTHLAVRRGTKTLAQMSWADIGSVKLIRGDSLLRMTFDITSAEANFPYILAKPTDVWDVRGSFPPLLAVLPGELQRLETALKDACAARALSFSVENDA